MPLMPIRNAEGEIIGAYDPDAEAHAEEEARYEREMEEDRLYGGDYLDLYDVDDEEDV